MTMRRSCAALLFAGVTALPAAATAQECPEGVISLVFVDNNSIYDSQELADERRFRWVYELINTLHVRTRQRFIQRELLFGSGDCYAPALLEESERLLREYPFIARADVFGLRQPDDSWHVVVDTQDEWTTKLDLGLRFDQGLRMEKIELTEESFLGRGILLGAFYRERNEQRDLGVRLELPRLGRTRTDTRLSWGRTRRGDFFEQALEYPFVGEIGRVAGRQIYLRRETFFPYSVGARSDADGTVTHVLLPLDERRVEVTLAGRVGEPGNLTIFGIGFSNETVEFPAFPDGIELALAGDFDDRAPGDSAAAAAVRHQTLMSAGTLVNLLIGQRNVRFAEFRGLDALRGTQDVGIGTDVALTLGRTVAALSDTDDGDPPDDLYARLRVAVAVAPEPFLLVLGGGLEGRQAFSGEQADAGWTDVLADLGLLFYWQPRDWPRHTFFARLAGAGGWRVTQPFQLTLGGSGRARGYGEDDFPGGRRVVFSAEDRIYLGWPFPELFDLGITLFADIGGGWAGDAPFGMDTGWRGTLGSGLRIGFPAGSGSVARIDLAWPLEPGGVGSPFLRISLGDPLGLSAGLEDRQLARSRQLLPGPDVFTERRR